MNDSSTSVEDLIRTELHHEAASVAPIDDLLEVSTQRGRRKQLNRRMAIAGSGVAAAAIVVGGSLAIANSGNSTPRERVNPAHGGSGSPSANANSSVTPWWTTWPQGRHFGPVDQDFLTNARPTYDGETSPESIKVWATGSEADGTDWVLYTSPHSGHILNYVQGWNGQPDYGDTPDNQQPGLTWQSFTSPTLASHNDASSTSQYLIIVGKPGTTTISYAADGTTFVHEPVQDGISVVKLGKFPPGSARVQLATAHGVYATGTPAGAGAADVTDTPSPGGGTSVPTATPSRPA